MSPVSSFNPCYKTLGCFRTPSLCSNDRTHVRVDASSRLPPSPLPNQFLKSRTIIIPDVPVPIVTLYSTPVP